MSRDLFEQELLPHQAWADAEHWRAVRACPAALADRTIAERLHHIVTVQRGFRSLFAGEPFTLRTLEESGGLDGVERESRDYHAAIAAWIATASEEDLGREMVVPWFPEPPCRLPVSRALLQVVMHSHYHRAQNATRLRELGGDPPLTDLIVWYWKGRPEPRWPADAGAPE